MTMQTSAAQLGDIKRAGAGVGISLTTTVARTVIPLGTRWVSLEARNYSTAVAVYFAFNPYMSIFKTSDLFATIANVTDYSAAAQDNSTSTIITLSSLDTLANLNAIYIGAHIPFEGVDIDVQNTNSNASVLTVAYRKSDNTWASTSATDNTASGGATFAVDGTVTWTRPTDWIACNLNSVVTGNAFASMGWTGMQNMFWTRWVVSAALDSSVTLNSMLAIERTSNHAQLIPGESFEQAIVTGQPGGWCTLDALTDAGTANLVIKVAGGFGNV